MSSTRKFLMKKKFLLRDIKQHERQQVLDFIRLHYYLEEPLTVGSEPKQQDKEDEDWIMSHIGNGTCFIACTIDNTDSQESIVGAIISSPKGPDEADQLFKQAAKFGPTKMGHILQILACVEREANVFERFNVKKVLHIHVLGVNNKMRGQNIGHQLIKEVINKAKSLNYEMVTVDCTSFYSARLFKRISFECINIKYYKDYVDLNGKQVFKPDPIHECIKTFALRLKTS